MAFTDFQDILDFAIKREEEAIEGYGKMREIAKTPGLEKLLVELQEEEKKHKDLLENVDLEKVESLEIHEVIDLKISDFLVEEPLTAEMTFQDLLIFAAKKEQKAVELYTKMGQKAGDEDFLVEQEKAHKLKLEDEYEKHVMEWD
jgi:rubrerythrin